ncbi:DNA-binding transcriptional regulator, AcrR family [Pseudobutyrivibrio sp. 49]|uniref:TetR/AcrR family transcriptional regulator n=1 Tax=unclassified Pseudobutyrivibrio TaxID=2638619 RepID=UPI00088D0D8C|nr:MULTISPECIES: TetR/AcrR family transcriptional regulator [unclassified Pseudobutyrivibrio]SDH30362.1 DNA-binding transcriptional regulator, AcrR family [Pseudobutyrivibrio sp. 49]SFN50398.1 transcriptional regulator, TetR family [Pseudobutyrivibrio sp. UC1225]
MNQRILEGALNVFKEKGPKFTMDDLASEMKMSKKTIYTVFNDKNELMCEMVDYAFNIIKEEEDKVYNNAKLSTVEKLRGILVVLPENSYGFDYAAMQQMAEKYPMAHEKMNNRLESGWEKTFDLLTKGMEEGKIRPINLEIFKLIYGSSVERLLMGDFLKQSKMDYPTALKEVVDVLIDGILIKEK